MRLRIALFCSVLVTGCANLEPMSEGDMLFLAKKITLEFCAKNSKDGCEFKLRSVSDGTLVSADPIFFHSDGRRIYAVDGKRFLFFDRHGLLRDYYAMP